MYSIYVVANNVACNLSLTAIKTMADGKATMTRFSDQSTYVNVQACVRGQLAKYLSMINDLLGITMASTSGFVVVPPAVDVVTGV
jgi:phosphoribosylpyrophosphate synthetase